MRPMFLVGCALAAGFTYPRPCLGDDLPSPLRMRDAVDYARTRNPQLAAEREMADAAKSRVRGTGLLDDPTLSFEWWQQPINFATVPLMLSVRQPLPWPGRLKARRLVIERGAAVARDQIGQLSRQLDADVRESYLELLLAQRSAIENEQQHVLLEAMVAVADAKYRVATAPQADVLRIQSDLLSLENEHLELELKADEARARINALLDRPGDAALPPLADELAHGAVPPASDAIAEALQHQPAVLLARDALAEAEARASSARHEADPEFAVWGGYMFNVHGADTFTAGVSSTLPVFSARRRSATVAAENAEVRARRAELRSAERKAEEEVRTALLRLEAADRHARLHAEKLIPVADVMLKSAEAAYQNNRIDLLSVLDAARMVRDHHLNHERYLVEYEKRLADLELAIGQDLPREVSP